MSYAEEATGSQLLTLKLKKSWPGSWASQEGVVSVTPKGVVLVEEAIPDHCSAAPEGDAQLMYVLVDVNCEVSNVLPAAMLDVPVRSVGAFGAVTFTEPLRLPEV